MVFQEKSSQTNAALKDAARAAMADIDKRRRAQAKERAAWAGKVDSLKRAGK